jgi:hypothetical protein
VSHQAILRDGAQLLARDVAVEGQSGFARWYQDMRRAAVGETAITLTTAVVTWETAWRRSPSRRGACSW